jgi:hypothetical protein
MSQTSSGYRDISRRSWLALAASAVTGCGGGGGSGGIAGLPGTGGTGIYAQGTIAGFGSVIVNSVKYDDRLAQVQIDGVNAVSADLRLGMVAEVQGQLSADPMLGTASTIAVWSIAQGAITQVQAGQFTLMGMVIQPDGGTVYEGLSGTSALAVGQRVSVWGLQSGADGVYWTATRMAISSNNAPSVVTGVVATTGQQRSVNGVSLSGNGISALSSGQWVRVQGDLTGTLLQATHIQALGSATGPLLQGEAEIEGVVTAVLAKTRFMLGNIEVDASSTSLASAIASIATGARLEVKGTWQGRVLKAAQMSVEDDDNLHKVEIEGSIQQFSSLADFIVRNQRCNASATLGLSSSTVGKLKVGVKVKIEGRKSGDAVLVTKLELSS